MYLYQRKKLRLKNYDYSSPGCYFVTILAHNRSKIFWDNDNINELGKIVENEILCIKEHYTDVKIDNYVIMPDHVHLLVTIGCDALGNDEDLLLDELLKKSIHPKLENVVGSLKSGISRKIHILYPTMNVWHKSFYDHIITNSNEYDEIWDYIDANPIRWKIKHGYIKDNTCE